MYTRPISDSAHAVPFVNLHLQSRDRPRFFDQVGRQTTNASIENTVFPRIVSAETILF